MNYDERISVLNSLNCVDEVIEQSSIDELPGKIEKFEQFLKNNDESVGYPELGELSELGIVRQHPVRLKCVLLPVRALNNIINQS